MCPKILDSLAQGRLEESSAPVVEPLVNLTLLQASFFLESSHPLLRNNRVLLVLPLQHSLLLLRLGHVQLLNGQCSITFGRIVDRDKGDVSTIILEEIRLTLHLLFV